jgi:hypothetical protein
VYLYTSGDLSTGSYLAAGSGTWADLSDRNRKANVKPVAPEEVLARVVAMAINTWSYRAENPSIRHMGPMAQDMRAAFGLGDSDKSICTIDADGVALAAIQGLHKLVKEKDAKIANLEQRLAEQETRLARIEAAMHAASKNSLHD